jgi:hypothetical protein
VTFWQLIGMHLLGSCGCSLTATITARDCMANVFAPCHRVILAVAEALS